MPEPVISFVSGVYDPADDVVVCSLQHGAAWRTYPGLNSLIVPVHVESEEKYGSSLCDYENSCPDTSHAQL